MRKSSGQLAGPLLLLVLQVFGTALVVGQRLDRATKAYEDAMANRDAVSLALYTDGARELQELVRKFGKLFAFADGEFSKLVRNLEQCGATNNPAYESIQSAIEYELGANQVRSKQPSATRAVTEMQWALRWLSNFMDKLSRLADNDNTASAAKKAYSDLFGKKHPWIIRTAVNFALRTLPRKEILMQQIMDDDSESANDRELRNAKLAKFASVTDDLIKLLDRFYADKNLIRF